MEPSEITAQGTSKIRLEHSSPDPQMCTQIPPTKIFKTLYCQGRCLTKDTLFIGGFNLKLSNNPTLDYNIKSFGFFWSFSLGRRTVS